MPSLNTFQVNTSALHDSGFCQTIRITAVLSLSGTQNRARPNNIFFFNAKLRSSKRNSQVECVHCLLTISNVLNAKRQSMEICLDLSISTNRVTKKTDEVLILN